MKRIVKITPAVFLGVSCLLCGTAQSQSQESLAEQMAGCYRIDVDSTGHAIDGHLSPSGIPTYVKLSTDPTGWNEDAFDHPADYKLLGQHADTGDFVWDWDRVWWRWVWGFSESDSLVLSSTPDLGGYRLHLGTEGTVLRGRVTISTDYVREDLPETRTMPVSMTRVDCTSVP